MAKYEVTRGDTSVMIRVFLQSNAVTTGAGLTGLTNASTNLQISMIRQLSSTPEVYTGADIETITTIGTYAAPTASTNIRFKAVDGTNMPGWYELQFHNSANQGFGSGDASKYVNLHIFEITTTALNLAPCPVEIALVAVNKQDATRGGMTALPNANAEAAGGLYTRGTGAGQIAQTSNGTIDINTAVSVSGAVGSVTGNVGGNVTGSVGSVTGAVGSVTGAVGSVTGNVGGNVTGSVGSVVGAVGSVTGNVGGNVVGTVGTVNALANGAITALAIATGAIDADAIAADAANEIATALLDLTDGVETGVTVRSAFRRIGATTAGKVSGAATTTNTFLGLDGSTTRVTATVDSDGNRSAITYA